MKLRKVINASGKMSILGVSTISEAVQKGMKEGASDYYIMEELHREAGKEIATQLGTEAAIVTNSASSGIALAVAGVITGNRHDTVHQVYEADLFPKREVVVMKGHAIDYGAPVGLMIEIGAGRVIEAGYANGCTLDQIKAKITPETAAILFVQSHHTVQKGMAAIREVSHLAKESGIPFIVDAAAEENWQMYSELADLFIISGSKALNGPTSGIIAGGKKWINMIRPHQHGIGRAMKVGKETIFGVVRAFQHYGSDEMNKKEQLRLLESFNLLEGIPGVMVSIHQDQAGREIYRARITVDKVEAGMDALQLTANMKQGDPAIYTRDYYANIGHFEIDPRSLTREMAQQIIAAVQEQLDRVH